MNQDYLQSKEVILACLNNITNVCFTCLKSGWKYASFFHKKKQRTILNVVNRALIESINNGVIKKGHDVILMTCKNVIN